MTCTRKITSKQAKALAWLNDHGGIGDFIAAGQKVIAQNTLSPYDRATWVALRDAQRVSFIEGKVHVK